MKLLKIEEHNYSIVYVNDNEEYKVYRRFSENKWEVFYRNNWIEVDNKNDLELLLNDL
jgi:hypothetical protein